MTTKTIRFALGRVYCVNLGHDDGMRPLLLRYQGPERPWENICSGESARVDIDDIDDAAEVPAIIVQAIALANRTAPQGDELDAIRDEDEAPEMWEHDVYWDD